MPEFRNVQLDLLNEPPAPVRVTMDPEALEQLAGDIRLRGLINPISVRPVPPDPLNGFVAPEVFTPEAWEQAGGRYEVKSGHRRTLACRMAGQYHVPVRISAPNEGDAIGEMLAENFFREDVTAAEEGWKLSEYIELYKPTLAALCALTGQREAWINERLDLVRSDAEIAGAVAERKISFSVAKELLRVNEHTAALVLRCNAQDLPREMLERFRAHRMFLLDLCIKSGVKGRVAKSYVEQWKASLVPTPATPYGGDGSQPPAYVEPPPQRCCAMCGQHDLQNCLTIYLHPYEWEAVKRILAQREIVIYE